MAETQVTRTELMMEDAIRAHAGDPERVRALERAKRFKRTWIELAEVLVDVRERESWRRWGFPSFDDYCARELRLRRGTVDKLCASYGFLRAHAPRLLREPAVDSDDYGQAIPSWQAVEYVARAEERGAATEETLDEMKRAVFDDGVSVPALARKYKEVAFPLADDERKERNRSQLLAAARRLAELVAAEETPLPRRLAERVEEVVGEVLAACSS